MLQFANRLVNGYLVAERNPQTAVHLVGGQLHYGFLCDLDQLIVARQPLAILAAPKDHQIAGIQAGINSVV